MPAMLDKSARGTVHLGYADFVGIFKDVRRRLKRVLLPDFLAGFWRAFSVKDNVCDASLVA